MTTHSIYDTETGRITRTFSTNRDDLIARNTGDSEDALVGSFDPDIKYVVNGGIVERPVAGLDKTSIAADGTDTAILSNLPDPCTVRVNGVAHEVTSGQLEITASKPAIYEIEIRDDPASGETAFPLQAFKAIVEAT